MKRLKRAMVAAGSLATVAGVVVLLVAASTALVLAGTGADPTDAFREPALQNTSLEAEMSWTDGSVNGRLGTVEAEGLADAWADAIALVERRSNGEAVDFARRFEPSIADSLDLMDPVDWSSFTVLHHRITLDLVTRNRQVVAITADVGIRRTFADTIVDSIDTYEAVLTNGDSGWVVVAMNRTASLITP